jgi:hypothetical protein
MKRLDDIPKKNIFETPDGYFEKLPGIIQSRIADKEASHNPVLSFSLRYGLPAFALIIMVSIWLLSSREDAVNAEQLLASVDTSELVAYLEETDLTTDELLEAVSLNQEDVNAIESNVYRIDADQTELDELLNEYSLELNDF